MIAAIVACTVRASAPSSTGFTRGRTSSGTGSPSSSLVTRWSECRSAPSTPFVSITAACAPVKITAEAPARSKIGITRSARVTPTRRTSGPVAITVTTSAAPLNAAYDRAK